MEDKPPPRPPRREEYRGLCLRTHPPAPCDLAATPVWQALLGGPHFHNLQLRQYAFSAREMQGPKTFLGLGPNQRNPSFRRSASTSPQQLRLRRPWHVLFHVGEAVPASEVGGIIKVVRSHPSPARCITPTSSVFGRERRFFSPLGSRSLGRPFSRSGYSFF